VKLGMEVRRQLAVPNIVSVGGEEKKEDAVPSPDIQIGVAGPEGCNIVGRLMAKRVPGNFHVSALYEEGYSFDIKKLNLSHTVHHYSFGSPSDLTNIPRVPADFVSSSRLDDKEFTSKLENGTIEHYIKVVASNFVPLGDDKQYTSYKYTANTNEFSETEGIIPEARFSYDISPMAVVLKEEVRWCYLLHIHHVL
jgi:hypothetical protein